MIGNTKKLDFDRCTFNSHAVLHSCRLKKNKNPFWSRELSKVMKYNCPNFRLVNFHLTPSSTASSVSKSSRSRLAQRVEPDGRECDLTFDSACILNICP